MTNILRIKDILKSKGMTINDLADIMGINRVTLSNTINGNPTLETLQKIANHLEINFTELFYSAKEEFHTVSLSEFGNHFSYNDDNIFFNGFLPHLTQMDIGSFALEVKKKDFSIIPNKSETLKLVQSDKTVEEMIFKGNYKGEILVQLFSSYTSLNLSEHKSFCDSLKLYLHFHQQCRNEIDMILGTNDFKKTNEESDYYLLGRINRDVWQRLIKLTQVYDLDSKKKDFEKFNSNGHSIIMYNLDIESGYNIKMWISPLEDFSTSDEVMLGWKCPNYYDRNLIKTKKIFNASESLNFINNIMIPKCKNL